MALDQPNQSQQGQPEQQGFNKAEEWDYSNSSNRYSQNYSPYYAVNPNQPPPQQEYSPNTSGYSTAPQNTYSQPSWGQNLHRYESVDYSPPPPPSSIPYDPIRSNTVNSNSNSNSHHTNQYKPTVDASPASSYGRNNNTSQPAMPPIMSISQLLSSDNTEQTPNQKRNGIQNLLNDDYREEKFEMADTDTDNEDHVTQEPTLETTLDSKDIPLDTKPKETKGEENSESSVDDEDDNDSYFDKPKLQEDTASEELSFLSDEEDNEVFHVYKEEMLQFMINNHKRGKQVIEEYEKKISLKHNKVREGLEQLYEKRYGTRMPKGDAMVRKMKAKQQRKPKYNDDLVEHSSDSDIDFQDSPSKYTGERRIESERKHVWANIVKKDIPRMNRILSRVQATRSGNCKKIAQYCQKEVRRVATNGGRANRDLQNKAKRVSKEMQLFWKKNEKEERELRKKAEKEALDRLKQEEERREAQRQARKLNFLITQTELYSHFIGRKIKQDTEDDDEDTAQPAPSGLSTPLAPVLPQDELDEKSGVTEIGTVDFDEEDEAILKEKARLSAQNALAKQREQTRVFDEGARERRLAAGDDVSMALDEMNFQEPSSMGSGPEVKQPNMLMCQLKSYQIKGLSWLANLYEQGINGILADEMGLGKTVQSISLLAYLAEVHNIWGPFLVIAPASTLHNWQQEFTKFVPQFRALPYWGNPKDRKTLRQFWSRKQLYGKDAPFHIVITSYQLILTDVTYFQRVKWQYMILDEAQAIKSSSSARWKQLLSFHCRNRLLLTGTPIQNSMQELWALLHFIMPTLFDSHEEFSEWFSKDIESHAENKGSLNEHQLRRLHMILKPFMLRRIKRNVQHELGEKIELEVFCDLTARQKALYRGLKEKISISELLEKATSLSENESMDSLMNLVMQFRKVCNHPELFERGDVQAPLSFCNFSETGSLSKETVLYCPYSTTSTIKYHIPKTLYRSGGILKQVGPHTRSGFDTKYLDNLMNIWSSSYIQQSQSSNEPDSAFSFLRFIDVSPQEASYLSRANLVERWVDHLAKYSQNIRKRIHMEEAMPENNTCAMLMISDMATKTSPFIVTPGSALDELTHVSEKMHHTNHLFSQCYSPAAKAVPVDMICDDVSFVQEKQELLFNDNTRSCFFGTENYMSNLKPKPIAHLTEVVRKTESGIMTIPTSGHGYSSMKVPSMKDVILDSGKLATLDKLLEKLKSEDHRCLVYFQMTKMIDLFEEYISYRQYKYLRLDGSSKISDRRDMVQDWQTRPEIFIFLLSTRAGGLGINLTAADTVIFYDSDWNPTVDQQAMDRAHRLGQTKQVTVYRLITRNTIEERILQRAKQKDEIQKVVISGGEFRQVDFKPREIVSLLLDDEEMDDKVQQQLKRKAEEEEAQKKKPNKKAKKSNADSSTPVLSPSNTDQILSAGEDAFMEEDSNGSSGSKKSKGTRIGRPRTNISFTC
ncbi:SNF2 family N-terminal domain-containing protein [Sporodiniella umbellata]|nr:SNF2 family N-terminal domain-containing protein [Sporodiniella umbellata]